MHSDFSFGEIMLPSLCQPRTISGKDVLGEVDFRLPDRKHKNEI